MLVSVFVLEHLLHLTPSSPYCSLRRTKRVVFKASPQFCLYHTNQENIHCVMILSSQTILGTMYLWKANLGSVIITGRHKHTTCLIQAFPGRWLLLSVVQGAITVVLWVSWSQHVVCGVRCRPCRTPKGWHLATASLLSSSGPGLEGGSHYQRGCVCLVHVMATDHHSLYGGNTFNCQWFPTRFRSLHAQPQCRGQSESVASDLNALNSGLIPYLIKQTHDHC